ncbi:MAG TPA: hypothetical protein PLP05_11395 [Sedimentisphaerales bacterium]|nr:hypothetical protein [Sedimentisphaerales bacterium]
MKETLEKIFAFLYALLILSILWVPIFLSEIYNSKLIEEGHVKILADGLKFEGPQESWFLTPIGIFCVITTLILLIVICVISSKYFCGFNLKLWLYIVVLGWLAINAAFFIKFQMHKNDYIYIGSENISQRIGHLEWQLKRKEIKHIKNNDGAFLIYAKKNNLIRVTISNRLYEHERLKREFINLSEEIAQDN